MKFAGAYLWAMSGYLLIAVPTTLVAELLPEASFNDWVGVVDIIDLHDGSKLFEYSAQSVPRDANDSVLSISFVPRFRCVPVVKVVAPGGNLEGDDSLSVEVYFGTDSLVYRGFLDFDGDNQVYSISATTNEMIELRERLDISATVRTRVSQKLDDNAQTANTENTTFESEFSLSGSTLSARATELHCQRHSPQDYM